jgi:hypothetical protein
MNAASEMAGNPRSPLRFTLGPQDAPEAMDDQKPPNPQTPLRIDPGAFYGLSRPVRRVKLVPDEPRLGDFRTVLIR